MWLAPSWRRALLQCIHAMDSGIHAIKALHMCHVERNGMINEERLQHLAQVLHCGGINAIKAFSFFTVGSFMFMRCREWLQNWKAVIRFPRELADLTQRDNTRTEAGQRGEYNAHAHTYTWKGK